MEQVKNIIATIVLAILAYLEPIEGELKTLLLVFFLNFFFGYLRDGGIKYSMSEVSIQDMPIVLTAINEIEENIIPVDAE